MTKGVWLDVIENVSSSQRVIAFDLRGHGGSVKSGPYTAKDYSGDVLAVLDDIEAETVHLVGVSYGASIACEFSASFPDRVSTLTCIGGALEMEPADTEALADVLNSVGLEAFFSNVVPQLSFPPGADAEIVRRAVQMAVDNRSVQTVIDVITAATKSGVSGAAKGLSKPALVVTGELDTTCPVPLGRELASALGTELVVLEGYGHVLPLEAPARVSNLILQHVQEFESTGKSIDISGETL